MLMTVAELRGFIDSDLTDEQLEARLSAIEIAIRKFTNNNFQNRKMRFESGIENGNIVGSVPAYFSVGDTVEITQSEMNDGLFVVGEDGVLSPTPIDCENNLFTKIVYPADVRMGAANMLNWDLNNRDKVGISSETISRHSVTYSDLGESNSSIGYPSALTGFLKPYMKARF